jgi:hypothetical protein
MSEPSSQNPNGAGNEKPPKRHWEATRKKRFFDLKFSHWIEIILTTALVGIAYFQYTVYSRQANIMDKQAHIAAKQNDISIATERAWIWPTVDIGGDLVFAGNGSSQITLKYTLENSGNTPALDTQVDLKAFPLNQSGGGQIANQPPTPQTMPGFELRQFCRERATRADKFNNAGHLHGDPIFPGKTLDGYPMTTTMPAGSVGPSGEIMPVVLVCVLYRFLPDLAMAHYTGVTFMISKNLQPDRSKLAIKSTDGTIPAADLHLVPYPFRGGDAS